MQAYLSKGNQLTESFCQPCTGKFDFSHMVSLFLQIGCMYLEKLSVMVYSVQLGIDIPDLVPF